MYKGIISKDQRWLLAVNIFPKSAKATGLTCYQSGIHTHNNKFCKRFELYIVIKYFRVFLWIPTGRETKSNL